MRDDLRENRYPNTVIVAGFQKLIEEHCSHFEDKSDKQFSLSFTKISSILVDFCDFFAEKNEKPSALLVFSRLGQNVERLLDKKVKHWFSENWMLEESKLTCLSSASDVSIQFFLKDNQYYLESVKSER